MKGILTFLASVTAAMAALALAVPEGRENPFAVWKRPIKPVAPEYEVSVGGRKVDLLPVKVTIAKQVPDPNDWGGTYWVASFPCASGDVVRVKSLADAMDDVQQDRHEDDGVDQRDGDDHGRGAVRLDGTVERRQAGGLGGLVVGEVLRAGVEPDVDDVLGGDVGVAQEIVEDQVHIGPAHAGLSVSRLPLASE